MSGLEWNGGFWCFFIEIVEFDGFFFQYIIINAIVIQLICKSLNKYVCILNFQR